MLFDPRWGRELLRYFEAYFETLRPHRRWILSGTWIIHSHKFNYPTCKNNTTIVECGQAGYSCNTSPESGKRGAVDQDGLSGSASAGGIWAYGDRIRVQTRSRQHRIVGKKVYQASWTDELVFWSALIHAIVISVESGKTVWTIRVSVDSAG